MSIDKLVMNQKIRNLKRLQSKALLDLMGIPFDDQPPPMKKCKLILEKLAEKMPEDFDIYHDIVVHHKLPAGGGTTTQQDALKLQKLLSDFALQLEVNSLEKSKGILDAHRDQISQHFLDEARAIIEKAKSEFITHQIQVGNTKPRRVKGTPPKEFKKLCQLVQARKNILMVGPSGCGKTHVAGMLAQAFGMEYGAQSCSVGVSESAFVGWLLPIGGDGSFVHVPSRFVELYEKGGMFLLDEMDNADPNLLVFMNMALANSGFYLPQRHENPHVVKHPDFVCIAAANTFGGGADILYTSRNALDAATLDRFRIGTVSMDYDAGVEEALIQETKILKWGRGLRKIISNHNLAKLMSTRAMIDAQDMMVEFNWDFDDVEQSYFADWSKQELAMIRTEKEALQLSLRDPIEQTIRDTTEWDGSNDEVPF